MYLRFLKYIQNMSILRLYILSYLYNNGECVHMYVINFWYTYTLDTENCPPPFPPNMCCPPQVSVTPFCYLRQFRSNSDCHAVKNKVNRLHEWLQKRYHASCIINHASSIIHTYDFMTDNIKTSGHMTS